jgi:hypothetical protein
LRHYRVSYGRLDDLKRFKGFPPGARLDSSSPIRLNRFSLLNRTAANCGRMGSMISPRKRLRHHGLKGARLGRAGGPSRISLAKPLISPPSSASQWDTAPHCLRTSRVRRPNIAFVRQLLVVILPQSVTASANYYRRHTPSPPVPNRRTRCGARRFRYYECVLPAT